ncbi:MFS general substrate transporter [Amylostereum chailletii]|nr:MFS general substrate transporter [Amylostereum chailletii]
MADSTLTPPREHVDELLANEASPLIGERRAPEPRKVTPLPYGQITILLLLQLSEPVASQSILPYINQLVSELDITGGDERKVGYYCRITTYAGLIESLYFSAEAVTILQWSRLSDRVGRKPVLLIGTFGLIVSMLFFGLSKTFWTLVISRCVAGALNGNIGVMKASLAELTDKTNRAQGFSLMPVMWASGATIGPFIGGVFSRPHDRFPNIFQNPFWEEYPYFLPCVVAAAFTSIAFVLVALFLKETVHGRSRIEGSNKNSPRHDEEIPSDILADASPISPVTNVPEKTEPLNAILTRPVLLAVSNYAMLALLDIAFACMAPLFYSTPIALGGLGLSPASIGLFMGAWGVVNGLFQYFFFAKIVQRIGTRRVLFIGMAMFIPLFLWFPCANQIARHHGLTTPVWIAMGVQLMSMVIMDCAYGCTFIYVTTASPSKRLLGATNGIAQTVTSIMRAIGPWMATSLFAFSLDKNIVGGNGVYIFLILLSVSSLWLVTKLPEEPWSFDEEE